MKTTLQHSSRIPALAFVVAVLLPVTALVPIQPYDLATCLIWLAGAGLVVFALRDYAEPHGITHVHSNRERHPPSG